MVVSFVVGFFVVTGNVHFGSFWCFLPVCFSLSVFSLCFQTVFCVFSVVCFLSVLFVFSSLCFLCVFFCVCYVFSLSDAWWGSAEKVETCCGGSVVEKCCGKVL